MLADLDLLQLGYLCGEHTGSAAATHIVVTKT
jgi:hypothetical protein